MTSKRAIILGAMASGMAWAICLIWLVSHPRPDIALPLDFFTCMAFGLAPAGGVLALMIGRLAQRRFFNDAQIDGQTFVAGSGADIDQRVLNNTVEQLVLAVCLWPWVAMQLGGHSLIYLGWSFAVLRLLFWAGYHLSPPLRGFGFAATFYPTVVSAIWALWVYMTA